MKTCLDQNYDVAPAAEGQLVDSSLSAAGGCSMDNQRCLPCYCHGLKENPELNNAKWLKHTRNACAVYIDPINVRGTVLRAFISIFIVICNKGLVFALSHLVKVEKHWTQSSQVSHRRSLPAATRRDYKPNPAFCCALACARQMLFNY